MIGEEFGEHVWQTQHTFDLGSGRVAYLALLRLVQSAILSCVAELMVGWTRDVDRLDKHKFGVGYQSDLLHDIKQSVIVFVDQDGSFNAFNLSDQLVNRLVLRCGD